jgi:hypothetical protein
MPVIVSFGGYHLIFAYAMHSPARTCLSAGFVIVDAAVIPGL